VLQKHKLINVQEQEKYLSLMGSGPNRGKSDRSKPTAKQLMFQKPIFPLLGMSETQ